MADTKINELILKGNVKGENSDKTSSEGNAPAIDKEKIIEECLERVKKYLEYENGR